jgi:hypothetical protein
MRIIFRGVRLVAVLAILLGFQNRPILAQSSGTPPPDIAKCTKADLSIHFGFFRGPQESFNLSVLGQNVSGRACTFDGFIFYPSVVPPYDSPPRDPAKGAAWPECKDCKYDQRNGEYFDSHPLVPPGSVVSKVFRWKTVPSPGPVGCLDGQWISAPSYLLVTPSFLKNICSDIAVVSVDVFPMPSPEGSTPGAASGLLQASAPKSTFNDREMFSLRVSDERLDEYKNLFVWHRNPDGETRIDEVTARPTDGTGDNGILDGKHEPMREFEVDSGAGYRWMGAGEHELQVLSQIGPFSDDHLHFAVSNVLHIQVIDAKAGQRNWVRLNGLGVSLTLDKPTYQVGEDIPLHLAIANFDAKAPVFSWDPDGDPCIAVGVEVLDANGHPLGEADRVRSGPGCFGHGWGPKPFENGRIVALERHLKSEGWLPNRPGTYTIVFSWCTTTGSVEENAGGWTAHLNSYASPEARATFQIVAKDQAE